MNLDIKIEFCFLTRCVSLCGGVCVCVCVFKFGNVHFSEICIFVCVLILFRSPHKDATSWPVNNPTKKWI